MTLMSPQPSTDQAMADIARAPLSVRVVADEAAWDALEPEWSELFARSPQAATPLRFDWLREWWRIYGPAYGDGLRVITFRRGPQLVGVLPLYRAASLPVIGARRVGFLSTGEREYEELCPDYLNLLCLPDEESSCLDTCASALAEMDWDYLNLTCVPKEAPLCRLAEQGLKGARPSLLESGVCQIANLEGGFEEYLRRLSGKTRQHFRQYLRAAERYGAVLEIATRDSVDEFFDALVELHQLRWTSVGKPGAFSAPRFTEFHRSMARKWVPDGRALLARLSLGGRPLAVLYGFVTRSTFDYYQSGVRQDETNALCSPGTVAQLLLMARLVEMGVTRYDFLRGSMTYKESMATESRTLANLLFERSSARTMVDQSTRLVRRVVKGGLRRAFGK